MTLSHFFQAQSDKFTSATPILTPEIMQHEECMMLQKCHYESEKIFLLFGVREQTAI